MQLSLTKKLSLTTILLCLAATVPFGILAYLSVHTARDSFVQDRFDQLVSIREIKKGQIARYFADRQKDAQVLSGNPWVISALGEFGRAFTKEGAVGGPGWKAVEDRFGPWLAHCQKTYGYYDLFLITPAGDVVYTVAKEADLGANLLKGPLAASSLGECFSGARRAYTLTDFKPYAPSNHEPAAFLGLPIKEDGRTLGVLALQVSLGDINGVMQERTGMGRTGETYLVGPDLLMRSDSFLDPTHHSVKASFADPGKGKVDTHASRMALQGRTGRELVTDYNGNQVLSAYAPVSLGGLTWAILAEIDLAEVVSHSQAAQALLNMVWLISVLTGIILLLVIAYTLLVLRGATRTLGRVTREFQQGGQSLSASSTQVASASHSLAEGASEQASSLEETASSMEEMASMAKRNSESAAEADTHMRQTREVVEQGRRGHAAAPPIHEPDRRSQRGNRQDHQDHRPDRLPDQPAGLERRGGGSPGRPGRGRLRGGGRRGAQPGHPRRRGGQEHRKPDPGESAGDQAG